MKCLKCGSELLSTGMCSNLMCDYVKEEETEERENCRIESLGGIERMEDVKVCPICGCVFSEKVICSNNNCKYISSETFWIGDYAPFKTSLEERGREMYTEKLKVEDMKLEEAIRIAESKTGKNFDTSDSWQFGTDKLKGKKMERIVKIQAPCLDWGVIENLGLLVKSIEGAESPCGYSPIGGVIYASKLLKSVKGIEIPVVNVSTYASRILICDILEGGEISSSIHFWNIVREGVQNEVEAVDFVLQALRAENYRDTFKYLIEELGIYRASEFIRALDIFSVYKYTGLMKEIDWIELDMRAQVKTASFLLERLYKGDKLIESPSDELFKMQLFNPIVDIQEELYRCDRPDHWESVDAWGRKYYKRFMEEPLFF